MTITEEVIANLLYMMVVHNNPAYQDVAIRETPDAIQILIIKNDIPSKVEK